MLNWFCEYGANDHIWWGYQFDSRQWPKIDSLQQLFECSCESRVNGAIWWGYPFDMKFVTKAILHSINVRFVMLC